MDGTLLLREPRAVSRRLVRKAYALLRGDEKGLSYDHVERILAGADRRRGTTVIGRFGGVEVRNEYGRLVFLKPDEDIANALRLFKKAKRPMALVRDEDNKIVGLVTLEDAVTDAQFAFRILAEVAQVPEPGVLALLGLGLAAAGIATRRRNVR